MKKPQDQKSVMTRRLRVILTIFTVITVALVGRLAWVQVVWALIWRRRPRSSAPACTSIPPGAAR